MQLDDGAAGEVLDHPERHVHVALRTDREPPHRLAVAQQQGVDQLAGGVAAAEVQRLGRLAVGHRVLQRGVDRAGLGQPLAGDRKDALQEAWAALHAGAPLPGRVARLGGDRGLVRRRSWLGGGRRRGELLGGAARPGGGGRAGPQGGAAAGGGICSAGPSTRATATAQTLKAGILLVGSRASASVSALALDPPPQWNGAKTTSGRIVSVTCAWNRARPRRVVSSTTSSAAMPSRRARSGCSSARAVGATIDRLRVRRVCVPDWYWAITRPVVRTYG